ncbi:MAG: T9SS type A sorting domain-containing protein [Saprospiraceae bacterium]|nr:T9SS type A sorting domain-containing protein [Saprospiraceae bacterium]
MRLYPNPTPGLLRVDLPPDFDGGQWQITDAQGVEIKVEEYNQSVIDIRNLSSGMYQFSVMNENGTLKLSKSFIKTR